MQNDEKSRAELIKELQAAEEKYTSLFEGAGDSILLVDSETLQILDSNTNATRRLGYSRDELLQLALTEIEVIGNLDLTAWGSSLSGTKVYECQYRCKDGSLVPVEVSSRLAQHGQRNVLQNFVRDISERKQAEAKRIQIEQELKLSEKRFREMAELLPGTVVEMDTDLTITYINKSGLELTGYTEEGIEAGTNALKLLHPDDRTRAAERIPEYYEGNYMPPIEYRVLRKDGTVVPVLLNAAPIRQHDRITGFRAAITDIRRLKEVEKALKQSEEQLRVLADNVPAYVAYVGIHDLRYRFVSRRFEEAYERPSERIIGQHIRDIIGESNYQFALKYIDVVRSGQRTSYVNVFEIAQGKRWIEVNYVPTFDDQGEVEGIVVLSFDITERKQAEAEREQLIADLEAYAHTVAHDLKNPVGLVLGYAHHLEEDLRNKLDDDQQQYFQTISRTALKMSRIIDDLLMLASVRDVEAVAVEELDMENIVSDAQERLLQLIEERQAEVIHPETWPVAVGYGPWVEEIWANYLSNAIKYGGTPPRVELGAAVQPDGMIRFWAKDNGEGLTEEEQVLLFTQFSRLENTPAQGHGLGLSIVKRIVEKLRGHVGVKGSPGQGSVFSFTLPVAN